MFTGVVTKPTQANNSVNKCQLKQSHHFKLRLTVKLVAPAKFRIGNFTSSSG